VQVGLIKTFFFLSQSLVDPWEHLQSVEENKFEDEKLLAEKKAKLERRRKRLKLERRAQRRKEKESEEKRQRDAQIRAQRNLEYNGAGASEFMEATRFIENTTDIGDTVSLMMVKTELLAAVERLGKILPPNTLDQLIDELGGPKVVAEVS
jgi:IS5 family transposase